MTTRGIVCTALVLSCPLEAFSYTITVFPQAAYNSDVATMDATLGLPSSFLFEDFDDAVLIPELHVTGNNTAADPDTTVGIGHSQLEPDVGIAWTLDQALKVGGYITPVKFEIVDGEALTFGIGMGEDQGAAARLRINGGPVIRLEEYANYRTSVGNPPAVRRNGYVKIEAGVGDDPIKVVQVFNGGGDRIYLDHVAIEYVGIPEPSSLLLVAFGAMLWAACRRR